MGDGWSDDPRNCSGRSTPAAATDDKRITAQAISPASAHRRIAYRRVTDKGRNSGPQTSLVELPDALRSSPHGFPDRRRWLRAHYLTASALLMPMIRGSAPVWTGSALALSAGGAAFAVASGNRAFISRRKPSRVSTLP